MAVPWVGIPLRRLVEIAEPLAAAKFLRVLTVSRPEEMPGWYASRRVFPYYEAVSIQEATNELAFLATGIYGHELPPQHGAPVRLVLPWKYGFKSAKSLVGFQFTTERPGTFWSVLAPRLATTSGPTSIPPRPSPGRRATRPCSAARSAGRPCRSTATVRWWRTCIADADARVGVSE